jgi:PAS domain S-box-containing protein
VHRDEDFKAYILKAQVGIIRIDAAGAIGFINPFMVRMLGYDSEGELIGRSIMDTIKKTEGCGVIEKFLGRKGGASESYFLTLARKDGSTFIARFSSVSLGEDDSFIGSCMVVTDITREARLFDRLKMSEARFRNLSRQLPAAIFELDADSNIRYCNDFAHDLLGIDGLGCRRSLRSFVAEDELSRYDRLMAEAFGGRDRGAVPLDLVRKGCERLPALWSVALERWRDGKPLASVVVIEVTSVLASIFAFNESELSSYGLTSRELAVAKSLASGLIYKEIAYELGISLSTVRTHTMSLYRKIGIHSREELVDLANSWQVERYGKNSIIRKLFQKKFINMSAS